MVPLIHSCHSQNDLKIKQSGIHSYSIIRPNGIEGNHAIWLNITFWLDCLYIALRFKTIASNTLWYEVETWLSYRLTLTRWSMKNADAISHAFVEDKHSCIFLFKFHCPLSIGVPMDNKSTLLPVICLKLWPRYLVPYDVTWPHRSKPGTSEIPSFAFDISIINSSTQIVWRLFNSLVQVKFIAYTDKYKSKINDTSIMAWNTITFKGWRFVQDINCNSLHQRNSHLTRSFSIGLVKSKDEVFNFNLQDSDTTSPQQARHRSAEANANAHTRTSRHLQFLTISFWSNCAYWCSETYLQHLYFVVE